MSSSDIIVNLTSLLNFISSYILMLYYLVHMYLRLLSWLFYYYKRSAFILGNPLCIMAYSGINTLIPALAQICMSSLQLQWHPSLTCLPWPYWGMLCWGEVSQRKGKENNWASYLNGLAQYFSSSQKIDINCIPVSKGCLWKTGARENLLNGPSCERWTWSST